MKNKFKFEYAVVLSARDAEKGPVYQAHLEHWFGTVGHFEDIESLSGLAKVALCFYGQQRITPRIPLSEFVVTNKPSWSSQYLNEENQRFRVLNEEEIDIFFYELRSAREVKLSEADLSCKEFRPELAKRIRMQLGATISETANLAQVSYQAIRRYESEGIRKSSRINRKYLEWLELVSGFDPFCLMQTGEN